jgi:hypothetical protein
MATATNTTVFGRGVTTHVPWLSKPVPSRSLRVKLMASGEGVRREQRDKTAHP